MLHGVKYAHQFAALEKLYAKESMVACIGPQPTGDDDRDHDGGAGGVGGGGDTRFVFSAAQQTPLEAVGGYAATTHAARHRAALLARSGGGGGSRGSAEQKLGSMPWPDWPVFTPEDCNAADPLAPTAWDAHVKKLRTPGAFSTTDPPALPGL